MILDKLLQRIDQLKPNAYTRQEKIAWVNELDGMVKTDVIDTHMDGESISFGGYNDGDGNAELLIPAPFDSIYLHWLEAKIDYANAEFGKYNNSMAMFNTMWGNYSRWYNRNHMPKGCGFDYF